MKKPILYALNAITYIVFLVSLMNFTSSFARSIPDSILAPMVMLGLLTLSVAVMGFLFISEPLTLYIDGHKKEAYKLFGQIIGFFALFVVILATLLLFIK